MQDMNTTFKPLVSIVIPVYNGSNFLAEAIDSALAQTYKNIEIVVVNDGSKDDGATEKVALSYGDKIKYYPKPNGGVSSALNYGIEKMSGDYFSWLSHDDLYEPLKVEREVEELAKIRDKENTIICCADSLINANGKPIYHTSKRLDGLYSGSDLFDIFFAKHLVINGCTLLIHKSVFERFGGFSKFRYIQDIECWIHFMLGGVNFCLGLTLEDNVYVPSSALLEDIKNLTNVPSQVLAILQKDINDIKYTNVKHVAKGLTLKNLTLPDNIK